MSVHVMICDDFRRLDDELTEIYLLIEGILAFKPIIGSQ